ncbi:PucR family transcriptional regulator [Arthrobacter cavernae]|uniref:PucR family transcriptional regulator n=1 Tax=Arthrobacter cavernae TaxID=2817681 RepID=A0A939HG74_9MICC|nr:PucR family transcriptional regulator ligand-binding domain-containing protein [Arthrobacter cavernae]MBO1266723.1 PucR family transcriptional regulator [Arthrobacter cavernae]
MPILLSEILDHPSFRSADPLVRSLAETAGSRPVRWVHSSEVLDIAPLLLGGELLLSGGIALATATDERRVDYIRELAEREVAALALETGGALPAIPASMLDAAEQLGLPLVELRSVVPFVGIMQSINSMLVSESVVQLQKADQATHAMAAELAHGGKLDQILAVLARIIDSAVTLLSPSGAPIAGALPPAAAERARGSAEAARGSVISIDVPVRGVLLARLEIDVPDGADAGLARVAGDRAVDILGLALLQRTQPGLHEMAGTELMRAIISGSQPWRLQELGPAAGFQADAAVVAVVIRSRDSQQLRATVDKILHDGGLKSASYVEHAELIALVALPEASAQAARAELLAALAGLPVEQVTAAAVGPLASSIAQAGWSLAGARRSLELAAAAAGGAVIDAEALAVELLAVESLAPDARADFVRRQLDPVLHHDAQRQSQLLATLAVWLDSGCNTAQAARELHLERQSLHHRLQRIFELCGGDPRKTGRLAALHLATRLARL